MRSLWLNAVSNDSGSSHTLDPAAVRANAPVGYQVVRDSITLPDGGFERNAVDCPAGKVVLGGRVHVPRNQDAFPTPQSMQNSLPSMSCIGMHESLPS